MGRYQNRASSKYRSVLASDEGNPLGQLRETAIRRIQEGAVRDFRGRRTVPVQAGERGFSISITQLTAQERSALQANRSLRAQWNRIIRSFADLIAQRARRLSRPTYDTGLFSSSWKANAPGDVKIKIELSNRAPYAKYVHRAGAPKRQTVVKTYIKPMVTAAKAELLNELNTLRAPLLDSIRAAVMAR